MKYHSIGFIILAGACMHTHSTYEYSDGNANRYVITETQLHYIPVKPEESSSGMYSGGEPENITLSSDEFNILKDLFNQAAKNTDVHLQHRPMMSGLIRIPSGTMQEQVILKPGCTEMIALEEALRKLLGR